MPKKTTVPTYVTKSDAAEIAENVVRKAIREQSRTLEKHLQDIDRRLRALEQRR